MDRSVLTCELRMMTTGHNCGVPSLCPHFLSVFFLIFTKHCEVHVSVITPILQVRKQGSQEVSFAQGLMDSKGSSQDFKPGGLSLETMFFFFKFNLNYLLFF